MDSIVIVTYWLWLGWGGVFLFLVAAYRFCSLCSSCISGGEAWVKDRGLGLISIGSKRGILQEEGDMKK